jgi:hypothetical protein
MLVYTHRQLFTLSLVFLLAACGVASRKTVGTPPPAPVPAATAAPAAVDAPTVEEESTQIKKPVRRTTRPAVTAAPSTTTAPSTPMPASPAAQPLQLGETLTPEQERQYNSALDLSLQRAQANLESVSKRRLSKEQQGAVVQVQSFMEQAQSARKTNLTAAKSLAQRAEVLARELARTVK